MEKLAAPVNDDEWVIIDGVRYEPRNKVIEECALVADAFAKENKPSTYIPVAIRALKDHK